MGNSKWLVWFGIGVAATVLYVWLGPVHDPTILQGFKGNLVSGLVGGVLFVALGIHINRSLDSLVAQMHALLLQRERSEEEQRRFDSFERFLRTESYHDIRLPNLKRYGEDMGLMYTIAPVLDDKSEPFILATEMETYHIVKVQNVAHLEVLTEPQRAAYRSSPIHTDEYYFCRFYNGRWHMGEDFVGGKWHEFYLSGKVGPAEIGQSANEIVGASKPAASAKLLFERVLTHDGELVIGDGSGSMVRGFQMDDGTFCVQFNESPLKRWYIARHIETDEHTTLVENSEGYFIGSYSKMLATIQRELQKKGLALPVVDWIPEQFVNAPITSG